MKVLQVQNRQRVRRLRPAKLKTFAIDLLEKLGVSSYELGLNLVNAEEMAEVNQRFLQHAGSTDVITFDYGGSLGHLHGELFISVQDACFQADEFRTTWQSELGRYTAHGILHLLGYDDLSPEKRRVMKRRENAIMREFEGHPALAELASE